MKIETSHTKSSSNTELLPQIVDRIFSICRTDPNFKLKDELEIVENKFKSLSQKIEKQDELLEQSEILKKDLAQRIEILNNQNLKKQNELLEQLGSEL